MRTLSEKVERLQCADLGKLDGLHQLQDGPETVHLKAAKTQKTPQ